MSIVLWSMTDLALATATKRLACEDSIGDLEAGDIAAHADDCSGAFVRCCYWELNWEDAFDVFKI